METSDKNEPGTQEQLALLTAELDDIKLKFVESDKLAFIGRLTAGILHEIKNPLNFINNFSKLSQELLGEMKEMIEGARDKLDQDTLADLVETNTMLVSNLGKILENGERAQKIVFSMLSQMREKQDVVFEKTDVNKLLDEFAKLAYQGMRGVDKEFNLTFKTDYDPSIGSINLGLQEISRVIINLVNNACYALNEKKKNLHDTFSPELLLVTKQLNGFVEMRIRDNGSGIPPSVINKLFTPFFTTKPKGQGTGLGLSLSYDIITDAHKGKIEVTSKENEYTEFRILIPTNLT
ncbi:MAG: two-component sensor histidine kinase [Bacteroidales bacterium]|nr:two-component sensor histidine kinase [Bacteroidales bacterium]MCF8454286.1 two-component sensor histidine kinase [Bacteroidales bacterium]